MDKVNEIREKIKQNDILIKYYFENDNLCQIIKLVEMNEILEDEMNDIIDKENLYKYFLNKN